MAANHWEYAYYFRHLGPDFTLLEKADLNITGPLWLVATAATPVDQFALWHRFERQGWQMLEQHEFTRTTVFLLCRSMSRGPSGCAMDAHGSGHLRTSSPPIKAPLPFLGQTEMLLVPVTVLFACRKATGSRMVEPGKRYPYVPLNRAHDPGKASGGPSQVRISAVISLHCFSWAS